MQRWTRLTDLVPSLLRGHPAAVERFVEDGVTRLYAIARAAGASREDAEEIVIDVVWETLRRLATLSFDAPADRDPLFSYLAKATKRGAYARHRSREAEHRLLARALNANPDLPSVVHEEAHMQAMFRSPPPAPAGGTPSTLSRKVQELLGGMHERDRLIVQLRSHTNLSWDEIAEEVGITSESARKRWQRLKARILKLLPAPISEVDDDEQ